jgi:hypothetical protein
MLVLVGRLDTVPSAGLIRTVLGKGSYSPQGGLKQLKLFTYILKVNMGFPELKCALFAIWKKV